LKIMFVTQVCILVIRISQVPTRTSRQSKIYQMPCSTTLATGE
jgi:hypothetical protein